MSASPAFASVPSTTFASVTVANTARDGSGTIVDLAAPASGGTTTAPAAGRRIDRIKLKATGQVALSMVMIFIHDGTSYKLLMELPVAATTPSTLAKSFELDVPVFELTLQTGEKLAAATTVVPTSGAINVWAFGGDLT